MNNCLDRFGILFIVAVLSFFRCVQTQTHKKSSRPNTQSAVLNGKIIFDAYNQQRMQPTIYDKHFVGVSNKVSRIFIIKT